MVIKAKEKKRRRKMSVRRAVNIIKRYQPKTLGEFERLGFKMVHLGGGCFRTVYAIKETDLVVKFAENGETIHNVDEVARIRSLGKHKWFRGHLPKVYYYDHANGIVVMHRYYRVRNKRKYWDAVCRFIEKLIDKATGVEVNDVHEDNLFVDDNGKVTFVDLGY
jgi:hypothetical protein